MNTTTYIGHGLHGERRNVELPAVGTVVRMTTGSTRTRTLRTVTGEVVDHRMKGIGGTEWGYWVIVVRTADGELVEDTPRRTEQATAEEIAEFEAAGTAADTEDGDGPALVVDLVAAAEIRTAWARAAWASYETAA
ncbi:hypothetical protein AB0A05_27285 [Streptomyces sp. NPDC046374]|uniref:hypothetical protein n=1 Tax=Streptomyces sp. NPDC046374 TaxID=3154917 RepID=UPI0033C8ACE5